MSSQPLRSLVFLVSLALTASLLVACTNSRRGGVPRDSSLPPGDADTDGGMMLMDSATPPVDSGAPVDSATPVDSGSPVDSGTPPMDSGRPDTGTPPTDSGTPPTDTGTPPTDSGLPIGDAGICVVGTLPCPAGQMCCEIVPGLGYGTCAVTCP